MFKPPLAGPVWPDKVILNLVGMLKRAFLRGIFTIEIRKKLAIRTGQGNRIMAKRHDKFAALFVDFADTLDRLNALKLIKRIKETAN